MKISIIRSGSVAVLLGMLSSVVASAGPMNSVLGVSSDPYFQVGSVEVSARPIQKAKVNPHEMSALQNEFLMATRYNYRASFEQFAAPENPMGIANIALEIWKIIEDNRAVLTVSRQNVKALPNIAKYDWTSLTGWKPEHGVEISLKVKNVYGIEVINLTYVVNAIYGGSVKGIGKFIASARVVPKNIDVLWGFNMDVNVAEVSVQNIGTEKNPVAAITLDVGVTYGSIMRQTSFTNTYRIEGDGKIVDVNQAKTYFGENESSGFLINKK